jgi:NAD(P)-dependent dehydrogenase (short-subunit alcohol dehydrogenase family)
MDVAGKTIGITGLSSGIGAATATLLITRGAQIVGFDRHAPDYPVAAFHAFDQSNPASIEAALGAVQHKLDALINSAGVPPTADKATVLKVNFFGLRHFTEHAAPHLVDGGAIVNLASLAGFQWRANLDVVKAGMATSFANADAWIADQPVEGAPSYHLSKELVIAWTLWNCQQWKSRRRSSLILSKHSASVSKTI